MNVNMSDTSVPAADTIVIGAGFSGLAASGRLASENRRAIVLEKSDFIGGHASSHLIGEFTFDEGPHISFTTRQSIMDLLASGVNGEFVEFQSKVLNYWRGHWIRHPAQTNLYGLPPELITSCIVDFVASASSSDTVPVNYAEWCIANLGRSFSEEFAFRYTRKYWTREATDLTTEWVGPRIYAPKLDEILLGALTPDDRRHHYLNSFRYPKLGGFAAYTNSLLEGQEILLGHEVTTIDLGNKRLRLKDGQHFQFDNLISSMPLPELISLIPSAPNEVRLAASNLMCTSVAIVSLGIDRADGFPDADWIYFYDEDISFSRIHFPHKFSENNAPPGKGSIQVEIYYSKYKDLPDGDLIDRTILDLQKTGVMKPEDQVLESHIFQVQYANVVFDFAREANLKIVHEYLSAKGVKVCGRYGDWGYHWTDDSIISGRAAADAVLSLRA
ncbi:MAG: FAD-dependent oxidoreductase [Chloroflexi bacterium]|nr:FAD-dependent oxidoreductase [Chloroflexota bacterium]